jgi:hypothetical protein
MGLFCLFLISSDPASSHSQVLRWYVVVAIPDASVVLTLELGCVPFFAVSQYQIPLIMQSIRLGFCAAHSLVWNCPPFLLQAPGIWFYNLHDTFVVKKVMITFYVTNCSWLIIHNCSVDSNYAWAHSNRECFRWSCRDWNWWECNM